MSASLGAADVATRFAPSPSGRLHLGHAFSALRAHDFARAHGGRFVLRIEDIDPGRTRTEFVAGIQEDLVWLGLDWDGAVVRQSERLPLYAAALDRLKALSLVYPCFCSRAEIAASAAAPHGDGGSLYPGTCRGLAAPDLAQPHCWRLDMAGALKAAADLPLPFRGEGRGVGAADRNERPASAGGPHPQPPPLKGRGLLWHDAQAGWVNADPASHGDIVLARRDAPVSYHLAVTVDDAAQAISDVMRGADLFAATHVHRLLQALLGLPTPRYHHHPLLTGADGRRLAKRDGAPALAALRAGGADPAALVAMLRRGQLPSGLATP